MGTCYVIMKLWIIVKAFIFLLSALDLHYEAKKQIKTKRLYFVVPCIQWETFVKVRWTARLNSRLLVKQQWSHVSFGTWWYLNAKEKNPRPTSGVDPVKERELASKKTSVAQSAQLLDGWRAGFMGAVAQREIWGSTLNFYISRRCKTIRCRTIGSASDTTSIPFYESWRCVTIECTSLIIYILTDYFLSSIQPSWNEATPYQKLFGPKLSTGGGLHIENAELYPFLA